jgi:hypothetical protein
VWARRSRAPSLLSRVGGCADSLLPIVFLAALSVLFEMRGLAGAVCIPIAVLWCANAASLFFVAALDADDRRWLLAYPVALFYTCFALISIF